MKKAIVLATAGFFMSFQAFGLEFQCESYDLQSLGESLEAKTFYFEIDEYAQTATVSSPATDIKDVGEYKRLSSPQDAHYLSFRRGADRIEFMISEDSQADVLQEYIISLGHNFDLSGEQLEELEQMLRSAFSGRKINGTMLILADVHELMSCRRL